MWEISEAQLQAVAARVAEILRAKSKGVGDLPVATSLDKLRSLPAIRMNNGVPEVLTAPIELLQDIALGAVTAATDKASTAAALANEAADMADAATEQAAIATAGAAVAKEAAAIAAQEAAAAKTAAETATANASKASLAATTAAGNANKEASSTTAAKAEALEAAARATAASALAEAEIAKMQEVEQSIVGATSLAPTRMELVYLPVISTRNPHTQQIAVILLPSFSLQNVLFLPAGGNAVTVDPAGAITVNSLGEAKVHVIPTGATHLYKTVKMTVRSPYVRKLGAGGLRLTHSRQFRLF